MEPNGERRTEDQTPDPAPPAAPEAAPPAPPPPAAPPPPPVYTAAPNAVRGLEPEPPPPPQAAPPPAPAPQPAPAPYAQPARPPMPPPPPGWNPYAGYPPPQPQWRPPAPQPPRRRSHIVPLIVGFGILGAVLFMGLIGLLAAGSSGGGTATHRSGGLFTAFGTKIAILEINGAIGEGVGFEANTARLIEQVKAWTDDSSVRALVLRINSPGGAVSATQELYAAINEFRGPADSRRPVVASMGDICASGGFYAAMAADEVFANQGTLTGSIGVIMSFLNYEGVQQKIGLSSNTIKSGEFKDMGSPTRPMTDAERELLTEMITDVYEQFFDAVADSRKEEVGEILEASLGRAPTLDETREYIRQYADGRIYSGRQAKLYGLIDNLGTLDQAIDRAAQLAKLPAGYGTVRGPAKIQGLFGPIGEFAGKLESKALGENTVRLEYRLGL